MRNKQGNSNRSRVSPDYILEVRVSYELWEKVQGLAKRNRTTYSWVVRYCLFRLIRKKGISRVTKGIEQKVKRQTRAPRLHRHMLCLYGVDEMFIRMTAAHLNCTMSHLVRLALEWRLPKLMQDENANDSPFHRLSFYWLGIKLYRQRALVVCQQPLLQFSRFTEREYW